ncbi:MAG: PQQ-binding-like beta-propeller repeat protein [Bacteroidia bacterium]|nr:PQQ-binding-like beta-propeller repeat protein [Bacteroidia bacterium]
MRILLPLLCILSCSTPSETPLYADKSWPVALGPGSNHATTLSQITTENISKLVPAWVYKAGDAGKHTQIQCNPLIINGKIFATTATLDVVCLDGVTGVEIWRSSPSASMNPDDVPSPGMGVNRGLVYARSPNGDRIFVSNGPYLFAMFAETGKSISDFGKEGKIDLRIGLREGAENAFVVANSPGAVYGNQLIIGCRVSEGAGAAPGHIRAYDIQSGDMTWIFHTIPEPGEPGYDTWPEQAWKTSGGANAWAGMTVDHDRGLVFVPTGSASYDFYGADRPGANLYANCLLALDAATGQLKWHFQFVHHDLLDRDLPAPPNLITIQRGEKDIPAVAQITKTGHVFIFHRETGEPIYPINEIPVAASTMPGEASWPTQPLPSSPPPFSRQRVEGIHERAEGKDSLAKVLARLRQHSIFEPPSMEGTLVFPGYDGGGEWGGAAYDPWKGLMVVNSSQMAWTLNMVSTAANHPGNQVYLTNCASCHGADRSGGEFMGTIPSLLGLESRYELPGLQALLESGKGSMPSFAYLSESDKAEVSRFLLGLPSEDQPGKGDPTSAYVSSGYKRFLDKAGYPAISPPWGLLTAIDLNAGEIKWQIPLGEYPELVAKGIPVTGTENYGGPLVTASGLTFIAATKDEKIRAFSTATGDLLWEANLPAGGYATPAMYEANGKQYLIVACGGGKMGTKSGDAYVAFAIP